MRLGSSLVVMLLLGAIGCGLNPQPEPPSEANDSGASGGGAAAGAPGAGGGPAGGGPSGAAGASMSGGSSAAGSGGSAAGSGGSAGGGGAAQQGAALPDSPTPYCTGDNGEAAPCPPSGSKTGEDGAFQGPVSSFVDEGDRLRDTLTQLAWQKSAIGPISALDVATTACPTGSRTPTLLELLTLADFGRADGKLPPFGDGGTHFASTPKGTAALALPAGGSVHAPQGIGVLRCVSGPAFVVGFAVDPGGATVTSTLGLKFERADAGVELSWTAALDACHAKGGGARLPTVKELYTQVDDAAYPTASPAFSAPSAGGLAFWSSTADPTGPRAFVVSFDSGDLSSEPQETLHQVRCVVP